MSLLWYAVIHFNVIIFKLNYILRCYFLWKKNFSVLSGKRLLERLAFPRGWVSGSGGCTSWGLDEGYHLISLELDSWGIINIGIARQVCDPAHFPGLCPVLLPHPTCLLVGSPCYSCTWSLKAQNWLNLKGGPSPDLSVALGSRALLSGTCSLKHTFSSIHFRWQDQPLGLGSMVRKV